MSEANELEAIRARHVEDKAFCVVMRMEHPPQIQDIATLLRLLDAARDELREDYAYAKQLLLSLHAKHFPDGSPDFEALPDLGGVLTQIDNLTMGLTRAAALKAPPTRAQGESS